MATPDDIDAELTLEIDGQNVTPEKFVKGTKAFFSILKEVTKDVCRDDEQVDWRVQVKAGSNLVGVFPTPASPIHAVHSITEITEVGIRSLEERAEEPADFPLEALKYVQDLGKVVGGSGDDDTIVRLWCKKEPTSLSYKSVVHVDELLKQKIFEDHGSVEGKLDMATRRGTQHFMVYEPVWDKKISCHVDDDLLKKALEYFGERVEVYGMIRYKEDGTPVRIKVEKIVPFPDPSKIPRYKDVKGILRGCI